MDPLNAGKLNSFFGEGTVLKGKLKFKGILRLDGELEGEVTSGDTFIVGKSGKVHANIKTDNLFNFGGIVGNVDAKNKISLHAKSSLRGDINSPYLLADESSFFEGSCRMPLEKRQQIGKSGKGALLAPSSASIPSPPAGIAQEDYEEGASSSAWGKIIAILMVVGALGAGWYYFGDEYWPVVKKAAVQNMPNVAADYTTDPAETAKPAEPVKPQEPVKKAEAPKPAKKPEPAKTAEVTKEPVEIAQPQVEIKKKEEPKPKPQVEETLSETDRLRKEIENKPFDPQPRLKLVFNSLKGNNYKEAIAILKESVEALPESPELRILIARTYQKAGREKEAQKHFLALGKIDPGSIEARVNDGYGRLDKGALQQAADMFGKILEDDPENQRARLGLATVYSRREENDKAALECLRILEFDKDYAPALNRLAWIYAKQGLKLEEAKALSERSTKVFSDIPEYLDTLSEIHFRLEEYDKAIDLIKKAIALAPNDSYYERQLFKFQRARKRQG
ncbi:hypothetical protein MNBD_NITROSPINAE02-1416 [hydrothermal vent metagenome]|uniref:Uncharacterized protein n=1 Tax=hydrothermal vent metagenome TaxID=652676 RepID=A0A3B1CI87_9ZZZZ